MIGTTARRQAALMLPLALLACDDDVYSSAAPEPRYGVAALEIVSGLEQEAKSGLPMTDPLVVRAVNLAGDGVAGVPIVFRLDGTRGRLSAVENQIEADPVTVETDADGLARVFYTPHEVGSSTVLVHVVSRAGRQSDSPVRFTFDVMILAIPFLEGWGVCPDPFWCLDPDPLPVGTIVEWVNLDTLFHSVSSLSVPEGAAQFDSGTLEPGDRFRVVLNVTGIWTYEDPLRTDYWDFSRTLEVR